MPISGPRTGQVNTSAFEKRLDASSASKTLENFKSNGTKSLIHECVVFMRQNDNKKDSQQLVKYLMGKTKQMPAHFKQALSAMPKETQSMLRDLLRTERFGFKKESFEKTLAKFEALNAKLANDDYQLEPND